MKRESMANKKNVLAIIGSASKGSSNLKLVNRIAELAGEEFELTIYDELMNLPHFNPMQTDNDTPGAVVEFRKKIVHADGIIISTPEYIFSIPSGLKNAFEWCVSTTVFSNKAVGLITASANGVKGHDELKLIMKTINTRFTDKTTLLIHGIKGKIDQNGNIHDTKTEADLCGFAAAFGNLLRE